MGKVIMSGIVPGLIKPVFGTPLSTYTEGSIIKINENGSPVEFYVAKHNYETELNGAGRTLVVRKDCYDTRQWSSSNENVYATSAIDSWLNGDYKNLFGVSVSKAIGSTKFKYTPSYDSSVGTLERAIFLLSLTELGKSHTYANTEGSALPIASTLKIAYQNGSPTYQWTRSPSTNDTRSAWRLDPDGDIYYSGCGSSIGSRPAFTLPSTIKIDENGQVIE